MAHMALACNLLKAIGGKPRIAYKDVINRTSFPRKGLINNHELKSMKGHFVNVRPNLLVGLRPLTIRSSKTKKNGTIKASILTFMKWESPIKFEIHPHKDTTEEDTKNNTTCRQYKPFFDSTYELEKNVV